MTDLYTWMRTLNSELGTDVPNEVVAAVLDLARDAAHHVVRPAAPLSAYIAGYAAGCARRESFDVEEAIATLARAGDLAAVRGAAVGSPGEGQSPSPSHSAVEI